MSARSHLVKLARALQDSRDLLSTKALLDLAHQTSPSELGTFAWLPVGDYKDLILFICVASTDWRQGSGNLHRDHVRSQVPQDLLQSSQVGTRSWHPCYGTRYIQASGQAREGQWHGFVLLATANIKPKSRKQIFFVPFSARYHCLSRIGSCTRHNSFCLF